MSIALGSFRHVDFGCLDVVRRALCAAHPSPPPLTQAISRPQDLPSARATLHSLQARIHHPPCYLANTRNEAHHNHHPPQHPPPPLPLQPPSTNDRLPAHKFLQMYLLQELHHHPPQQHPRPHRPVSRTVLPALQPLLTLLRTTPPTAPPPTAGRSKTRDSHGAVTRTTTTRTTTTTPPRRGQILRRLQPPTLPLVQPPDLPRGERSGGVHGVLPAGLGER